MNEDFVYVNSWFETKYMGLLSSRYMTMKTALNLFLQRGGNLIVETGTLRVANDWGGGCSTLVFGDFCKRYGKKLITVDISSKNMEVSKQETKEFAEYIQYIISDSVEFLKHTVQPRIDLLYLDSMDCLENAKEDDPRLIEAQEHNLKELEFSLPKLHLDSIVLLDDNNFPNGGKTKKTKRYLMENGWICVLDYQQTLWVRR
jgi:predicted O-methyltransferase YrrM